MEHLISLARGRGLLAFTAETLSENAPMLRAFADAGLLAHRALADGVYDLTFPLPTGEADVALGSYRDAVAARERSADVASLRHVLAPASGSWSSAPACGPASVGRVILHNIVTGGFSGLVYAVHPAVIELEGVPCVPSAAALPEEVDLAVIATPAAAVVGIAEECGQRGVKALVVLAAGRACGPRGRPEHLPPPRHADGRAGQLRGGRHQRRPRCDVPRPAIPGREAPAWRCSRPAAPASPWPSTCRGSVSGSPRSSRWAT